MENPKVGLEELQTLFASSAANDGLDLPSRQLAAQMCVLTAHVARVEKIIHEDIHALAQQAANEIVKRLGRAVQQAQTTKQPPTQQAESTPEEPANIEAAAFEAQAQQQAQADVAAAVQAGASVAPAPPPPVLPLRQRKGGGKPDASGGAA